MSFVWDENISAGVRPLASNLNEIQENIDSIYTALSITRTGCGSGAGWTEFPIATGLLSAQPQQLRDAIDYAYENKCPAYNSGYQDGVDTSYKPGYDSSDEGVDNSGYLSGVDSSNYPGAQTGYQSPQN